MGLKRFYSNIFSLFIVKF